jgi:hypothetical protein
MRPHSSHHSNPAHDLVSYGTIGLELNRTVGRREREIHRDRVAAALGQRDAVTIARQWLGDAIVRLGTGLAGEQARTRRVPTSTTPKIDMA